MQSLGCGDTPVIPVLNKWDKVDAQNGILPSVSNSVRISAKNGTGIDRLLEAIEENLPVKIKRVKLLIPFDKGGLVAEIRQKATLISEEYVTEGISIEALLDPELYGKLSGYLCD